MLYTFAKYSKGMSDGAVSMSSVIWHVKFGIEILAYGRKHL